MIILEKVELDRDDVTKSIVALAMQDIEKYAAADIEVSDTIGKWRSYLRQRVEELANELDDWEILGCQGDPQFMKATANKIAKKAYRKITRKR